MRALEPRERKLIAVAILVAACAGVWLLILSPLIGGFIDRADERAQLTATYAGNARIMAALPLWRREAEQQRRTQDAFAISAPTPALAAEILKTRLSGVVSQEGGSVKSVQNMEDGAAAGLVSVRASLDLTQSQLYRILGRLENEEPYVVVEYLSVAADRGFQPGSAPPLDVSIEVAAAVRGADAQ